MWTVKRMNVTEMLRENETYIVPEHVAVGKDKLFQVIDRLEKNGKFCFGNVVKNEVTDEIADIVVGLDKLIASHIILNAIEQLYRTLDENLFADELKKTYLERVHDGEKVAKFKCEYHEDNDPYKPISVRVTYSYLLSIIRDLDHDDKVNKLKRIEKSLLRSFFIWVETDSVMEANRILIDTQVFK